MFVYQGVDWWLVGTITTFFIFGVLIVGGLWLDYKRTSKIGDEEGVGVSNPPPKNGYCKNMKNPGEWINLAMTKFFQKYFVEINYYSNIWCQHIIFVKGVAYFVLLDLSLCLESLPSSQLCSVLESLTSH